MNGRARRKEGEKIQGLDLAVKNIELKEEVRSLKEKHNVLLRESLQHQYLRYKIQRETEQVLVQQKHMLEETLASTNQLLHLIRKDAEICKTPSAPKEGLSAPFWKKT
ncbi:hypothetical protein NECID01_0807 [Nematocida sp. AWRm77]|nr:hypothetical protein NECID01_0807 [Nematocida sp. AWRm77]